MKYAYKLNDLGLLDCSPSLIALDLETDVKTGEIKLIQIAPEQGGNYLFTPDKLPVLKSFLEQKTIMAHNAAFEMECLYKVGILPEKWIDTMLIERIILGGDPYRKGASLADCVDRHLGVELSKDKNIRMTFGNEVLTPAHYNYAAGDVAHMFDLYRSQLKHKGIERVVELELDYLPIAVEMSLNGFRIDEEGWHKVIKEVEQELEEARRRLRPYEHRVKELLPGLTKKGVKWTSPKQKLALLQDMGLPVSSTAKDVLLPFSSNEAVKALLDYAAASKQNSMLGAQFLDNLEQGIIRTHYNQIIATGRTSSSGVNLQNIPKHQRQYFLPRKDGNVFVTADFSQQELVILAHSAGEEKWLEEARKPDGDLHTLVASMIVAGFGDLSHEEQQAKRKWAKMLNFSLAYGKGVKTLASDLGLPFIEAQMLITKLYRAFPAIEAKLTELSLKGKTEGYTETLPTYCRKRYLGRERDRESSLGRQGKNSPIQGTGADMTKLACVILARERKRLGLNFTFAHMVHDEIMIECGPSDAEELGAKLLSAMEEAGEAICSGGVIKADLRTILNKWA